MQNRLEQLSMFLFVVALILGLEDWRWHIAGKYVYSLTFVLMLGHVLILAAVLGLWSVCLYWYWKVK